eukprot:m51a1_g11990 putative auxin transport protein big-like (3533) ;mRNA; f:886903-898969
MSQPGEEDEDVLLAIALSQSLVQAPPAQEAAAETASPHPAPAAASSEEPSAAVLQRYLSKVEEVARGAAQRESSHGALLSALPRVLACAVRPGALGPEQRCNLTSLLHLLSVSLVHSPYLANADEAEQDAITEACAAAVRYALACLTPGAGGDARFGVPGDAEALVGVLEALCSSEKPPTPDDLVEMRAAYASALPEFAVDDDACFAMDRALVQRKPQARQHAQQQQQQQQQQQRAQSPKGVSSAIERLLRAAAETQQQPGALQQAQQQQSPRDELALAGSGAGDEDSDEDPFDAIQRRNLSLFVELAGPATLLRASAFFVRAAACDMEATPSSSASSSVPPEGERERCSAPMTPQPAGGDDAPRAAPKLRKHTKSKRRIPCADQPPSRLSAVEFASRSMDFISCAVETLDDQSLSPCALLVAELMSARKALALVDVSVVVDALVLLSRRTRAGYLSQNVRACVAACLLNDVGDLELPSLTEERPCAALSPSVRHDELNLGMCLARGILSGESVIHRDIPVADKLVVTVPHLSTQFDIAAKHSDQELRNMVLGTEDSTSRTATSLLHCVVQTLAEQSAVSETPQKGDIKSPTAARRPEGSIPAPPPMPSSTKLSSSLSVRRKIISSRLSMTTSDDALFGNLFEEDGTPGAAVVAEEKKPDSSSPATGELEPPLAFIRAALSFLAQHVFPVCAATEEQVGAVLFIGRCLSPSVVVPFSEDQGPLVKEAPAIFSALHSLYSAILSSRLVDAQMIERTIREAYATFSLDLPYECLLFIGRMWLKVAEASCVSAANLTQDMWRRFLEDLESATVGAATASAVSSSVAGADDVAGFEHCAVLVTALHLFTTQAFQSTVTKDLCACVIKGAQRKPQTFRSQVALTRAINLLSYKLTVGRASIPPEMLDCFEATILRPMPSSDQMRPPVIPGLFPWQEVHPCRSDAIRLFRMTSGESASHLRVDAAAGLPSDDVAALHKSLVMWLDYITSSESKLTVSAAQFFFRCCWDLFANVLPLPEGALLSLADPKALLTYKSPGMRLLHVHWLSRLILDPPERVPEQLKGIADSFADAQIRREEITRKLRGTTDLISAIGETVEKLKALKKSVEGVAPSRSKSSGDANRGSLRASSSQVVSSAVSSAATKAAQQLLSESVVEIVRAVSSCVTKSVKELADCGVLCLSSGPEDEEKSRAIVSMLQIPLKNATVKAVMEKMGFVDTAIRTALDWGDAAAVSSRASPDSQSPFHSRLVHLHTALTSATSSKILIETGVDFVRHLLRQTLSPEQKADVVSALEPALGADALLFCVNSISTAIGQSIGEEFASRAVANARSRAVAAFLSRADTAGPGVFESLEPALNETLDLLTVWDADPEQSTFVEEYGSSLCLALVPVLVNPRVTPSVYEKLVGLLSGLLRKPQFVQTAAVALSQGLVRAERQALLEWVESVFLLGKQQHDSAVDTAVLLARVAGETRDDKASPLRELLFQVLVGAFRSKHFASAGAAVEELCDLACFVCTTYECVEAFVDTLLSIQRETVERNAAVCAHVPWILQRLLCAVTEVEMQEPRGGQTAAEADTRLKWWYENSEDEDEDECLCTFTKTGKEFAEQPWYCCYTCKLSFTEGCCSVCARKCHKGHELSFHKTSKFFCDCGAGAKGVKCRCLKPPEKRDKAAAKKPAAAPSDSLADEQRKVLRTLEMRAEYRVQLRSYLTKSFERVRTALEASLCSVPGLAASESEQSKSADAAEQCAVLMRTSKKSLDVFASLMRVKRSTKPGAFDVKQRSDPTPPSGDLELLCSAGLFARALLAVGPQRVFVAESDKIVVSPLDAVLDSGDKADKVFKYGVGFEIVGMKVNAANPSFLAVYGTKELRVLTLAAPTKGRQYLTASSSSVGSMVADQLEVVLSLPVAADQPSVVDVQWLPGSEVALAVTTTRFVRIYDLSKDSMSPAYHLSVPPAEGSAQVITSSCFCADSSAGRSAVIQGHFAVCCTLAGAVYALRLADVPPGTGDVPMSAALELPESLRSSPAASVWFAQGLGALVVTFNPSSLCIGRVALRGSAVALADPIVASLPQSAIPPPCMLWSEVPQHPGALVCSSVGGSSVIAVRLSESKTSMQALKVAAPKSSRVEGLAALSAKPGSVLALYEDGSLARFVPSDEDAKRTQQQQQAAVTGEKKSGKQAGAAPAKRVAVNFFEKVDCITPQIVLGGDVLEAGLTSDSAKQRLLRPDEYLVSPKQERFEVVLINADPSVAVVGVRVFLGNASLKHIPQEIRVLGHRVATTPELKRWYDIPFTMEEALAAEREIPLQLSACHVPSSKPVLDSLEVYGLPRDEIVSEVSAKRAGVSSADSDAVTSTLGALERLLSMSPGAALSPEVESRLPALILDKTAVPAAVRCSAKRVVACLAGGKGSAHYHEFKDGLLLRHVRLRLQATASDKDALGVAEYVRYVTRVAMTAEKRAANVVAVSPDADISALLHRRFWDLCMSRKIADDTVFVVESLVKLQVNLAKYAFETPSAGGSGSSGSSGSSGGGIEPYFGRIRELLLSPQEITRVAASNALCSLLSTLAPPLFVDAPSTQQQQAEPPLCAAASSGAASAVHSEDDNQYRCDVCGTVPIAGRRWHCDVCVDYDLCDACHAAGRSGDDPHKPSHSMTAHVARASAASASAAEQPQPQPHQADISASLVPDGVDPDDEETLLRMALTLSVQEEKRKVEDSKPSALLKALLGALLALAQEVFGPDRPADSSAALPVFRSLYYALAAAGEPGAAAVAAAALFPAAPASLAERSRASEVAAAKMLLLGSLLGQTQQKCAAAPVAARADADATPSRARRPSAKPKAPAVSAPLVVRARRAFVDAVCAELVQSADVAGLFALLGRLHEAIRRQRKSGEGSKSHAVPRLLRTAVDSWADAASGIGGFTYWLPLVSEDAVQRSPRDVFAQFHPLVAEAALRVAGELLRYATERPAAAGPVLALGWRPLLCGFARDAEAGPLAAAAKSALKAMHPRAVEYHRVCDEWAYDTAFRKLAKASLRSRGFSRGLEYAETVRLLETVAAASELAAKRPHLWRAHCAAHAEVVSFLFVSATAIGTASAASEESDVVAGFLKLLAAAFSSARAGAGAAVPASQQAAGRKDLLLADVHTQHRAKRAGHGAASRKERECEEEVRKVEEAVAPALAGLADGLLGDRRLARFVRQFLVMDSHGSVRAAARDVLTGLWARGRPAGRSALFGTLWNDLVSCAPSRGKNAAELVELIEVALADRPEEAAGGAGGIEQRVVELLRKQNEAVERHPNAFIYQTLSGVLEVEGHYLEAQPCLVCHNPDVPFAILKLSAVKSEIKFTDRAMFVKLNGAYVIQGFAIKMSDIRKTKYLKVLNVYYNSKKVSDITELKNKWELWKKVKSSSLHPGQSELVVNLAVPVTASNLVFEYAEVVDGPQAAAERLSCPRCGRQVSDRHSGVCRNCHENAYQCRQCRNINYENLEAFICNECGYCKHEKFDICVVAKPSLATTDVIETDDDVKKSLSAIERECENAYAKYEDIVKMKASLNNIVGKL